MAHLPPAPQRLPFSNDALGGLVLMLSAILALLLANGPFGEPYFGTLHVKLAGLSLLHWVNDGLMAVFFFLVGLEIKRELLAGELDSWPKRVLPGLAAFGGMVVPMLVYVVCNLRNPALLAGTPIPAATDIAFALGILAFFGRRVPVSLKIFLTALAILDDLGAIILIAAFYTENLDTFALGLAACTVAMLALANRMHINSLWLYGLLAAALWVFTLHSGIHATLAGVVAAMFVPMRAASAPEPDSAKHQHSAKQESFHNSPLVTLEHTLKPWVNLLVLPLFGLANAGVALGATDAGHLQSTLVMGVFFGLLLGKQLGVFTACMLAVTLGWARLPTGANWGQMYGVAVLCGIGFTMSLFIGMLAFAAPSLQEALKVAVLAGSALSAVWGVTVLLVAGRTGSSAAQ